MFDSHALPRERTLPPCVPGLGGLRADQLERIRCGQATQEDHRCLATLYADLYERAEQLWDSGRPGAAALWEVTSTFADLVEEHPDRGADILDALHSALRLAATAGVPRWE